MFPNAATVCGLGVQLRETLYLCRSQRMFAKAAPVSRSDVHLHETPCLSTYQWNVYKCGTCRRIWRCCVCETRCQCRNAQMSASAALVSGFGLHHVTPTWKIVFAQVPPTCFQMLHVSVDLASICVKYCFRARARGMSANAALWADSADLAYTYVKHFVSAKTAKGACNCCTVSGFSIDSAWRTWNTVSAHAPKECSQMLHVSANVVFT